MRVGGRLTDEQIDALPDPELEAWSDTQAIGPWEPNHVRTRCAATEELALQLPADLLAELRAEAALHQQPSQRFAKDLLLFALRLVQAGRGRPSART